MIQPHGGETHAQRVRDMAGECREPALARKRIANEGKMLDGLARGAFPTAGRLIQNDV